MTTIDKQTNDYLARLRTALTGMTLAEREDIVQEIQMHIRERSTDPQTSVEEVLAGSPPAGDFAVEDIVTVVLALSNGLAIEQYIDPNTVSSDLFGRVLVHLSGHVSPRA